MPDSTFDRSVWDLAHPVARLRDGRLSAQVDVSRPQLGLQELRCDDAALAGQLLCVAPTGVNAWPANVADAYVRGDDLVARYEPTANWPYAPQLYWRAEPAESDQGLVASLSLLVSIQTTLLDTHPRIDVASSLAAEEVFRVAIGDGQSAHVEALVGGERTIHPRDDVCCVLRRLPGGKLSYGEFMPASDFRQLSVSVQPPPGNRQHQSPGAGECRTRWELFAEFLEKGVIRRTRLQIALLAQENDLELAAACCRALKRRPLPLTA